MDPDERGPKWDGKGRLGREGGITVDGEPAHPAAPHPKYVEAGTCQGSCLWKVIDSDKHGLLHGCGDTLGLPIHDGETVQLHGMACGVDMVLDRGDDS